MGRKARAGNYYIIEYETDLSDPIMHVYYCDKDTFSGFNRRASQGELGHWIAPYSATLQETIERLSSRFAVSYRFTAGLTVDEAEELVRRHPVFRRIPMGRFREYERG